MEQVYIPADVTNVTDENESVEAKRARDQPDLGIRFLMSYIARMHAVPLPVTDGTAEDTS